MTIIAPSILSADFAHLGQEIAAVGACDVDWIHVDVMDGRFVPNLTMGPFIVEAVRKITDKFLDVHLMMVEPENWIDRFAQAGADQITVHVEASPHLQRTLALIRSRGKKAGVAINPATPIDFLKYILNDVDTILVMSVNPGFGSQSFLESSIGKIEEIARLIQLHQKHDIIIEVDGGISPKTAQSVVNAGASALVAGNAIFGAQSYPDAVLALRDAVSKSNNR